MSTGAGRIMQAGSRATGLVVFLALAGCATTTGYSWSSWGSDLDTWVVQRLEPYVIEQLKTHPRFKGEAVIVTTSSSTATSGRIDGLSASLSKRIASTLMQTPGVEVATTSVLTGAESASQCAPGDTAHYQIEVQVAPTGRGQHRVTVRAYDREDESYVSGFAEQWEGALSITQRRLIRKTQADERFRGQRELPFEQGQADLIAAYLARQISCELRGYDYNDLLIYAESENARGNQLDAAPELVGNNLVRLRAASATDDPAKANLTLRGKAHPISRDLYQYWIMVRPKTESADLPAIDMGVYVTLSGTVPAIAERQPKPAVRKSHDTRPLLSSVRVIQPMNQHYCDGRNPWRHGVRRTNVRFGVSGDECFGLEVELYRDAHLFILNHRRDGSLTRIVPGQCVASYRSDYPLDRGKIRLPSEDSAFSAGYESGLESFYALAVTDGDAARRLQTHLSRLPKTCGNHGGAGLTGVELENWLDEFDTLTAALEPGLDWRAVRVRHRN